MNLGIRNSIIACRESAIAQMRKADDSVRFVWFIYNNAMTYEDGR